MPTIAPLGDSSLLVLFEPVLDAAVNRRALAVAAALGQRAIAGVRDIVPAYASVAVHYDPVRTRLDWLEQAVAAVLEAEPSPDETPRAVEIPCCYDAQYAPDLAGVAALARLSAAEVVARHAARSYRVCMIGFLPGFPYLAEVDPAIAVPRHPTPRLCVAAGSVGLAGRQSGIYPNDSPGGWQIIGRTPVRLFDPDRRPPATLSPGDTVRFVPIDSATFQSMAQAGAGG